jgi:hypothetical protein
MPQEMVNSKHEQPRSAVAVLKRAIVWSVGGGLVVAGSLLVFFLCLVQGPVFSEPSVHSPGPDPRMQDLRVQFTADEDGNIWPRRELPTILAPPVRMARDVRLADSDEVVGVCVGGRARAYLLGALAFPWHVVNDVVSGHAVSVTYCDRANCLRVFTEESAKAPLRLDIAGQMKGGMILRIGEVEYAQKTGQNLSSPKGAPLPYRELAFERTTWRAWREAHPDTDVYVGDLPTEMEAAAAANGS